MRPPESIFFSKQELNELKEMLENQFGIKEIPGILMKKGKERIFLFNGDIQIDEIKELEKLTLIERAGAYIGKIFEPTGELRLSIEGTQIFKDQITKNIVEIDDEQTQIWMQGEELNIQTGKTGMVVIKNKNNFLGCGKASAEKIGNFIPKNRRLKRRD